MVIFAIQIHQDLVALYLIALQDAFVIDALEEIRTRKQALESQIAELQRQLEAFAIVERALSGAQIVESQPAAQPSPARNDGASTAQMIRRIVGNLEGEFSLDTVMEHAAALGIERSAVSYNLARFAKGGEISIVQEGMGRRAAIYKKNEHHGPPGQDLDLGSDSANHLRSEEPM